MTTHFNIAKKEEVNPFSNVEYVSVNENTNSNACQKLISLLNRDTTEEEVYVRKINGKYRVLFLASKLDFTILIKWFSSERGVMNFNSGGVHFSIEGDILNCW